MSVSTPPDLSQLSRPSQRARRDPSPVIRTCRLQLPCLSWQGARTLLGCFLCPRIQMSRMIPSCSAWDVPRTGDATYSPSTTVPDLRGTSPNSKGPIFYTSQAHATSWTLLRASYTVLVLARTGSCRSGPQHAPVPACSSTSRPWSCCGRLPQLSGQTAYFSAPADDDGFDGSDTIVLAPALGRIFSSPCPASPTGPAEPAPAQPQSGLTSGLPLPLPPASSASAPAPQPAPSQSAVASVTAAPATVNAPPDVQTMMQDLQDTFFKTMQARWQALMGNAPPQPTAVSSIPQRKMDPNELWQLSPTGDQEASRAQHKSGTKRADGGSRPRSPAGDVSETSRGGLSCLRQLRDSSASSFSSCRSSPPSKRLRDDNRSPVRHSCSQDDCWWSPGSRHHHASPSSHASHRSHSPTSHSQHRRSRDRSALSRRPSLAGMTRRLARNASLLPRRCSPSHHLQRSPPGAVVHPLAPGGCPLIAAAATLHLGHPHLDLIGDKCSRSRSPRSQSSDWDRQRRLHEADKHRLRLRDASPVPPQDDDQEADQNSSVDDSQLFAEEVKKLFDDLLCPPALSHYADPYPATDPTNTQLVPYNKDAAKAPTMHDNDELDTHDGLFKTHKSFHRLSRDQDREARTSAYHEFFNLMLSQTSEDKHLINITAARPKTDGPFHSNLEVQPAGRAASTVKETQRVMNRTLGLYQHGKQSKAGSSSYQWPSPTVENPWNKEFSPEDFPTAHKIPSTLPKRWELHGDSALMLKPPTSTVVEQVPDTEIAKCSSWQEAFAVRSAHSATISSTSLEVVYNFMQKVITFLRSSVVKDSIKNDVIRTIDGRLWFQQCL